MKAKEQVVDFQETRDIFPRETQEIISGERGREGVVVLDVCTQKEFETAHLEGKADDAAAVFEVREQVREAVEAGIEFLLAEQASDPRRGFLSRLFGVPRSGEGSSTDT